jgi:hypothetical protein
MHGEIVLIGQSFMGVGQGASHWGVIRATLGDNRGDGWCVWRRARRRRKRGLCAQQSMFRELACQAEASECRCMAWEHHVGVVVEMWWVCGGGDGGGGEGGRTVRSSVGGEGEGGPVCVWVQPALSLGCARRRSLQPQPLRDISKKVKRKI